MLKKLVECFITKVRKYSLQKYMAMIDMEANNRWMMLKVINKKGEKERTIAESFYNVMLQEEHSKCFWCKQRGHIFKRFQRRLRLGYENVMVIAALMLTYQRITLN